MSALKRLKCEHLANRENSSYSEAQLQTKQSFGFKWSKRDTYESDVVQRSAKKWLFDRYCDNDPGRLAVYLAGNRKIILDVGCGSGYSAILFFGEHLKRHDYMGIDISDAVYIAEKRFKELGFPGEFLQADMTDFPIPNKSVDMIFAEGTLHHTDDTGKTIDYLAKKLKKRGRFLFYVYRKKGAIREFTDDYIRNYLKDFSDEEAWEKLMPLTKLSKAIGDLQVTVEVPEDIDFLGIPKGKTSIHRLFYWYFCKLFYKPEYRLDEMNHINFDWYRPLNCQRHTEKEIISFCKNSDLEIEHINVQKSGITVVARKK